MKDFRAGFCINIIGKEYVFAFPTAKVCCFYAFLCYFSGLYQSKFWQEDLTFVSVSVWFFSFVKKIVEKKIVLSPSADLLDVWKNTIFSQLCHRLFFCNEQLWNQFPMFLKNVHGK